MNDTLSKDTQPKEAKADAGKPRPSLAHPSLVMAVTQIREYGCKKLEHDAPECRTASSFSRAAIILCGLG